MSKVKNNLLHGIISNSTIVLLLLLFTATAAPLYANEPIAQNDYAVRLLEKGEYNKALELLQKAYGMYPYDLTLKRNLAEAYAFVGQKQMSESSFESAAASFDRARELFPDIPRFYVMRGIALYYCKYADAAQNELERARGIGGDSPEILFYLAKIQYDNGALQPALDFLDKTVALKPEFTRAAELAEKIRRELTVDKGVEKGYSSRFYVTYDSETGSALAKDILSALEDAYSNVGRDLSIFPGGRIAVNIYTKKDFKTVTAGPDWSGGVYDGKIRLPVGGMTELNDQFRSVLFHEYTHVAVHELTHGNVPTWLNEGLAELQGRKVFNHQLRELGKAAKTGAYTPFDKLEGGFLGMGAKEAALAYEQSYSIVNFMVTSYGWPKVTEILQNLGKGMKPAEAISKAMADFGLDFAGVVEEWRGYMKREFGGAGS